MIRRTAHWLLVLALSFSIGLHWALLQSAAWVGMIVTYSQTTPLPESIQMTFDGKHPCKLCEAVQQGSKSEKKKEPAPQPTKLDLAVPDTQIFVFQRVKEDRALALDFRSGPASSVKPPTPPPRAA